MAEEIDGAEAGSVEKVMDIAGEIEADGLGRESNAGGPVPDEIFDVGEAMVAGELEVERELGGGRGVWREGVGAGGPDGSDPGEAGAGVPLVGEVDPEEGAGGGVDAGVVLAGEEGGIADEESGVSVAEHLDGVGGGWEEGGVVGVELAEEDLKIGNGAAGGGIGRDGANGGKGVGVFDEEEDGADVVERGDGAAGDDGERGGEGGDGNEAEVGVTGEELVGAEGGCGVVDGVAGGEDRGDGRVLEVPHERGGVEEADGGDAEGDGVGGGQTVGSSLVDARMRRCGVGGKEERVLRCAQEVGRRELCVASGPGLVEESKGRGEKQVPGLRSEWKKEGKMRAETEVVSTG